MPTLRRSRRSIVKDSVHEEDLNPSALVESNGRSRRALTDVSNQRNSKNGAAVENAAKSKRHTVKGKIQVFVTNTEDNMDTDQNNNQSSTRTRSSFVPDIETGIRQTRSRSRSIGDSGKNESSHSKSGPSTRSTRSRLSVSANSEKRTTRASASKRAYNGAGTEESQPQRKCARRTIVMSTTETKVAKKSKDSQKIKKNQTKSSSPTICSDFLTTTDYGLVQVPFDSSKYTLGIAPYDRSNQGDALMATDYVTDIFQRLYDAETTAHPSPYMHNQRSLSSTMRAILVDWLVEVHMKFHLVPETLYLCINIIDRYLSVVEVDRGRLQLVGVTALLLACKYEEIYPPEVRDCVYITDRAYTRQDVLDMERDIVQTLKFKMTVPTGYLFLQRFLHVMKATKIMKIAANYYMERLLQEYTFVKHRPSLVAAAVVCLVLNHPQIRAHDGLDEPGPGVPDSFVRYTGFSESDILEVAKKASLKIREEVITISRRELVAVKRKYEAAKFQFVSLDFHAPDVAHILSSN